MYLVAQSCLTVCDSVDCSLPGYSVHGDSPGKNTGVGCHAVFQGIFPTQGLNPHLPHHRRILYHLNHQGSPKIIWYKYGFGRILEKEVATHSNILAWKSHRQKSLVGYSP